MFIWCLGYKTKMSICFASKWPWKKRQRLLKIKQKTGQWEPWSLFVQGVLFTIIHEKSVQVKQPLLASVALKKCCHVAINVKRVLLFYNIALIFVDRNAFIDTFQPTTLLSSSDVHCCFADMGYLLTIVSFRSCDASQLLSLLQYLI